MSPSRFSSYVLCTSPRSGSTLLCALLRETGVAGAPDSHFHRPSLDHWLTEYGLADSRFAAREDAVRAVFDRARDRGSAGTGLFGLRMQRGSFQYFIEQVDRLHPGLPGDVARIEAAFGPTLFLHLRRQDKLAQAVSRVMAEQTGLWHRRSDGSELERVAAPREPVYDGAAIARHMTELAELDAEWDEWFSREGVSPLRLTYEGLASAPQEVLGRVLAALGLDPQVAARIQPPTAKLADEVSREWMERFAAGSGA